jgi:hypothetical protein
LPFDAFDFKFEAVASSVLVAQLDQSTILSGSQWNLLEFSGEDHLPNRPVLLVEVWE